MVLCIALKGGMIEMKKTLLTIITSVYVIINIVLFVFYLLGAFDSPKHWIILHAIILGICEVLGVLILLYTSNCTRYPIIILNSLFLAWVILKVLLNPALLDEFWAFDLILISILIICIVLGITAFRGNGVSAQNQAIKVSSTFLYWATISSVIVEGIIYLVLPISYKSEISESIHILLSVLLLTEELAAIIAFMVTVCLVSKHNTRVTQGDGSSVLTGR